MGQWKLSDLRQQGPLNLCGYPQNLNLEEISIVTFGRPEIKFLILEKHSFLISYWVYQVLSDFVRHSQRTQIACTHSAINILLSKEMVTGNADRAGPIDFLMFLLLQDKLINAVAETSYLEKFPDVQIWIPRDYR